MAVDRSGNMAISYSTSSSTEFPSIKYAGRLATDPIGTFSQTEQTLFAGTVSQTSSTRWGDYSSTMLDPDGCTFWITNQYASPTWRTRIGSFRFAECAPVGGGGTPVYRDDRLGLEGVDAVIDKDRAAAVLGAEIGAEALLILTNGDGAYRNYGKPEQELLRELNLDEAQRLLEAGEFGEGSMGPKIEAAAAFLRGGGRVAMIARLDQGLEAVQGRAGTTLRP